MERVQAALSEQLNKQNEKLEHEVLEKVCMTFSHLHILVYMYIIIYMYTCMYYYFCCFVTERVT